MTTEDDTVACRTPAEGRDGVTSVSRWKYDAVRRAILAAVDEAGRGGLPYARLPNAVADRLSPRERERLGSVGWHVTTVKLNMEVEREIGRIPGVIPQKLVRL